MTRGAGRAMGSAPTPSGSPWAIGMRAMLAMVATLAVLVVEPPVLVLAVVAVGLAVLAAREVTSVRAGQGLAPVIPLRRPGVVA